MSKSTNVTRTFLHQLLLFQRYKNFKFCTFKKQANVTECKFLNYIIRWQMSKPTNDSLKFLCQLFLFQRYKMFRIFTFKMQVNVPAYNFRNSITNVKIYKFLTHIFRQLVQFQRYANFLFWTFKKQVKVTECNFLNYAIRQKMTKATNVSYKFLCQLSPFQIYNLFLIFDNKKIDTIPGIEFSQFPHSMTNVKIYNCHPQFCCHSSYRSRYIKFSTSLPSKSRSRSRSAIFSIIPFDCKFQNLQMSPTHFCAGSYNLRYITILTFLFSIGRSRSQYNFCNCIIRWLM